MSWEALSLDCFLEAITAHSVVIPTSNPGCLPCFQGLAAPLRSLFCLLFLHSEPGLEGFWDFTSVYLFILGEGREELE